ncbi:MAG: HEAT repeat domain-containing protein, partial [Desulfobacterales bacterium]
MLFRLSCPKNHAMPLFLLLIVVACAAKLNVPRTDSTKHLKHYSGFAVPATRDYWTNAGVKLEAGDKLLIMASGTVNTHKWTGRRKPQFGPSRALKVKISDSKPVLYTPRFYKTISMPAELKFKVQDGYYKDNSGSFRIDVFVIAKEKEMYLADILNDFLAKNPEDESFKMQLDQLYLANIDDIKHKSNPELIKIWQYTISHHLRTNIIWELEKRGSIDSLINCLSAFDKPYYEYTDLWDSATVSNLIDILDAIKRLGAPETIKPVSKFLDNPKYEVRWHALETLGAIKDPESVDAISMALYDPDDQIRLKVIRSLESVGHPKAIKPLSILLADDKKDVRIKAALALKKLGATEEQILDWEKKAKTITLDDLYQEKLTYQKAISEKEALQARLRSEADVK